MRRVVPTVLLTLLLCGLLAGPAAAALDPLRTVQWALDAIHLGAKPVTTDGEGVTVAVLDSGVDLTHPDLAGRVIPGPDLVDGGVVTGDPHGHGTNLAGIIAAAAGNGQGGDGIAPGARILAIRVLDAANHGRASTLARGIDAAVAAGADVINLSLNWSSPAGSGVAGSGVDAALQRAEAAGIAVIVAAGNAGLDSCEEPAQPGSTLCVGALDDGLELAPYSSHGAGLGVVAPGSRIVSTAPRAGYRALTGTSQAAAVTSGVAALLAGQGLRGRAILERLQQTARDLGAPGYDGRYGFGLIDAARATDGAAEGRIPAVLRMSVARRARLAAVRRSGLRVTCDAARSGTCAVRVRAKGVLVAKGKVRVGGQGAVKLTARPTRAGRRLLARGRALRATVSVGLAGVPGTHAALTMHR